MREHIITIHFGLDLDIISRRTANAIKSASTCVLLCAMRIAEHACCCFRLYKDNDILYIFTKTPHKDARALDNGRRRRLFYVHKCHAVATFFGHRNFGHLVGECTRTDTKGARVRWAMWKTGPTALLQTVRTLTHRRTRATIERRFISTAAGRHKTVSGNFYECVCIK